MSKRTITNTFLRVVLMCLGRGSDPNDFQPNRDDSMWWLRRDSLVRIVAAFLFHSQDDNKKELILIFEEDYARMELKRSSKSKPDYPSEQRIVGLWKAAALAPGIWIQRHGLSCRLVVDPNTPVSTNKSFQNKRQVLEYLQLHCSMQFLKEYRLNSDPTLVLRKTNKQTLEKVHRAWATTQIQHSSCHQDDETSGKHSRLASIYKTLLQPVESIKVIAGILHESCESELPCWGSLTTFEHPTNLQLCLFLGAVRDMHSFETRILQECYSQPLVRVRLGPIPEFTSKILTVVAHHHFHDKLGPAILKLYEQTTILMNKIPLTIVDAPSKKRPRDSSSQLHIIVLVPIPASQLSSNLQDRSRVLWCLVRLVVNTLWRSRLASAEHHAINFMENEMTLVFNDNRCIRLEQEEWVMSLAEQHHAAPSEHQILAALRQKSTSSEMIDIIQATLDQATFLLDMYTGREAPLAHASFLMSEPDRGKSGNVVALLRIRNNGETSNESINAQAKTVRNLCKARNIPIVKTALSSSIDEDTEGATVVILQHLCYQHRLLPAIEQLMNHKKNNKQSKKRRKNGNQ